MIRQRLFVAVRSVLIGWAALLLIAFLLERTLLVWIAPIVGGSWIATAGLALDCTALAATGWLVGRLHRASPIFGVFVFAATLTLWDFTPLMAINIPWLLRLAANALKDGGYLVSWAPAVPPQPFLLGILLAGGILSPPPAKPVSIMTGAP